MRLIRLIWLATVGVLRQAWLLPRAVAASLRQRRRQFALDVLEAERLDRIRNPSKYLGKS
jgi:hypothetical protein